jgi:hypothetical protein
MSVARCSAGWLVTSDVIELVTSHSIYGHRKDIIFTMILPTFQAALPNLFIGPA